MPSGVSQGSAAAPGMDAAAVSANATLAKSGMRVIGLPSPGPDDAPLGHRLIYAPFRKISRLDPQDVNGSWQVSNGPPCGRHPPATSPLGQRARHPPPPPG